VGEPFRPVAPVDPTNLRPMLFLEAARDMMLNEDWPFRAVSVVMEDHGGPGRFAFYGANHPDAVEEVHAGRVDISTLNPAAMLTMAYRGTGAFTSPKDVATIAVLPHDDRLGFAVADRLGFAHLADIAAARYPLRVSVRGSIDACTPIMVDVVLREHGFSLDDIKTWGGEISYDQPMPNHPSRIGRLERGELDAIFDEGIVMWADVPAVDYGGWPIYCRSDTSALLVDKFCRALARRRDTIPWDIGGPVQPPLPLERMARDSPVTPLDVPLHPQAAAVWRELGYL
jgi:hypothetical protein